MMIISHEVPFQISVPLIEKKSEESVPAINALPIKHVPLLALSVN